MGRRPNELILNYFERGQKIGDASNRYQYTCRSCGEHFPKGRVEKLNTHLLQKCPSMTEADRESVWTRIHVDRAPKHDRSKHHFLQQSRPEDKQQRGAEPTRPFLNGQVDHMSALETLAEVSKAQLDQRQASPFDYAEGAQSAKRRRVEFSDFVVDDLSSSGPQEPVLNHEQDELFRDHAPDLMRRLEEYNAQPKDSPQPKHPPHPRERPQPDAIDPQLQLHPAASTRDAESSRNLLSAPSTRSQRQAAPHRAPSPAPPTSSEPPYSSATPTFTILSPGAPPSKSRSRFTPARREAVSNVRKKGACIRCRMLKKSCSDDSPCQPCKAVSGARLWRCACVRIRLADELVPWGAASVHQLCSVRALQGWTRTDGEASVAVRYGHFEMQSPLRAVKMRQDGQTGWQILGGQVDPAALAQWLGSISSVVAEEHLDRHIRELARHAVGRVAQTRDPLLQDALHLWTANELLLGAQRPLQYSIREPDVPPPPPLVPDASDLASLLDTQVQSLLERHCARRARSVATELERRLVQRKEQQANRFDTFLGALVLLVALGRLMRVLTSWGEQPTMRSAGQHAWPIETTPAALVEQAERVADVLAMLLVTRGVVPAVEVGPAGIIEAARTNESEGDSAQASAKAWLEALALTVEDVRGAVSGMAGPAAGDLKLAGRVLMAGLVE